MKNDEFIELLNLYVDHEITAADAVRLESEVLKNAERREIYQQYCKMQKACVAMADRFTEEAPAAAEGKVIAFATPRRSVGTALYLGGLAVAACLTVAFVLRSKPAPAPAVQPLAQTPAPAAAPDTLKPVFTSGAQAVFASADGSAQFDWISQVHMQPVQRPLSTDELFALKPDLKPDTTTAPRTHVLLPTEMTAFQLQK